MAPVMGMMKYTCVGLVAGFLLATGFWKSAEDLEKLWKVDQSFEPYPDHKTESIINLWEDRVHRILS